MGDHSFDSYFKGFGYQRITSSQQRLKFAFLKLGSRRAFDSVSVTSG